MGSKPKARTRADHPFGETLKSFLRRSTSYNLARLSEDTGIPSNVLSLMCKGDRLNGDTARYRLLLIVKALVTKNLISTIQEANSLFGVANGHSPLYPRDKFEGDIIEYFISDKSPSIGTFLPQEDRDLSLSRIVPPPPPLVVGRNQDISMIKNNLIHRKANRSTMSVVYGIGGIGKTTVALNLAHDPEILKAFPDGVLWTSLDKSPDVLSKIIEWGRALGSQEILRSSTLSEASKALSSFMVRKRMLLIIDDVWNKHDANHFMCAGILSATLVTTRERQIALDLASAANSIHALPTLTEQDSLELLGILAPDVLRLFPEECQKLVDRLEGLPLALHVAGRLLHAQYFAGFDIPIFVNDLLNDALLLEAEVPVNVQSLLQETNATVASVLTRSLSMLTEEGRRCFAMLGLFAAHPATFSFESISDIWEIKNPDIIIKRLIDHGLISYHHTTGRYQMHAILVMLAKSLIENDLT